MQGTATWRTPTGPNFGDIFGRETRIPDPASIYVCKPSETDPTVIDVREELIAFYERRGYRRTGLTKPFPYGDARFGLPKREDLRFEVLEKSLSEPAS